MVRKLKEWGMALVIVLSLCLTMAVILSPLALYGHLMYGDWRCGFAECRIVVEDPP